MEKVQLFEAKARLSELVTRAEAGKETVIIRRGRAVARLVPARPTRRREVDRACPFSLRADLPQRLGCNMVEFL